MRTVQMELLRPGEIIAEQERISLVYQPIGPVEWHSYHMPMGTDALAAQECARRSARLTGGVVAPTMFVGTEHNDDRTMLANLNVPHNEDSYILGMDYPTNTLPSLYLREEVFATIVREQLRLLAKIGYRLIVVVNGHGAAGQVSTLRRLCDEISHEHDIVCVFPVFEGKRMGEVIRNESLNPGHADRTETAMMMAITDSVALSELPSREIPLHTADFGIASGSQFFGVSPSDGVVQDDPREATAKVGEAIFTADAADLAEYVLALYKAKVDPLFSEV